MSLMNAFETYQQYLGLKLYFEGSFDYFKYSGKTNVTPASFDKRRDKYKFVKLSNKLSDAQIIEYFVSNFIQGRKYIGDFDGRVWQQHKKIVQSIEYNFENDFEYLLTKVEKFDILYHSVDGNHPILLKQYLGKKIKLETMVILEKLTSFCRAFDKNITDTIIWPDVSQLIKRYEPFLKVDEKKCNQIAIQMIKELDDG